MTIRYIEPLQQAWEKMRTALFRPFDISKWFTVGFTAFLAGLTDWYGGKNPDIHERMHVDAEEFFDFPRNVMEWLHDHPIWFMVIVIAVIFFIALYIVMLWLSSRGKFMFLDNVITNRSQVTNPWNQYRTLANSLFLWRFVFSIIAFFTFILFFIQVYYIALNIYEEHFTTPAIIVLIAGMALLFLLLIIIISYISLFLNEFIVPIMYKNRMLTIQAWYKFLPLFMKHWFYFIAYGLLIFLLYIILVIAIVTFGLFTCCIGFLLLIIPYVGSVILLPVSFTFRAFSVLFLEQFGEQFTLFPRAEEPTVTGTSA
ncbi:MAG: DUF7544 domain-containing protein [Candidatus Zhuqueibacterota bacterium]